MQPPAQVADKAVCTEDLLGAGRGAGAAGSVLAALVANKVQALRLEQGTLEPMDVKPRRSIIAFLRCIVRAHSLSDDGNDENHMKESVDCGRVVPQYWEEEEEEEAEPAAEEPRSGRSPRSRRGRGLHSSLMESFELVSVGGRECVVRVEAGCGRHHRKRRHRRARRHTPHSAQTSHPPLPHRRLLVSAIDEQMKVLDPDELPRRARVTIMLTACLLLFLCLLLVGVTLRMAPLIDDMVRQENERIIHDSLNIAIMNQSQVSGVGAGAAAVAGGIRVAHR